MKMENKIKIAPKLLFSVLGTAFLTALLLIVIWALTKDDGSSCVEPIPTSTTPLPLTTTHSAPATSTEVPAPLPVFDHFVTANLSADTVLHIWFRATGEGRLGTIYARKVAAQQSNNNAFVVATTTESDDVHWFDFRELAFLYNGEMQLLWESESTTISYIYTFEPEKVQEHGIHVLYISPEAKHPPGRSSFHLHPPLGWNNDPAGFSRTSDGLYHLFYEHNPHSLRWSAMHWGHAVSKDLVQWKHQPIFLTPEKSERNGGGIFTGSAIPTAGGGLRIYYCDHNNDRDPIEFQRSVLTKDMYRPMGPPRDAIPRIPEVIANNLTKDFRDPNVFIGPDGNLFMTTSSKYIADGSGSGAVMLFKQNATEADGGPEGWEFKGIIRKDNRWGTHVCECSALVPLGDPKLTNTLWALIYSMMDSKDDDGRLNLNPIIVGTFDGQQFSPRFEQMLDFAVGSYGFQGFYDPIGGESHVIGWLANWPDSGNWDFPSGFTLPRLIKLSPNNDFLTTSPHPSVDKLREKELEIGAFRAFNVSALPERGAVEIYFELYYWRIRIWGPLKLEMNQKGKGKEGRVTVIVSTEGLELALGWKNATEHRYIERSARPNSVRIFIDVGSVEVFADQGRWAGTARIPDEGHIESVQLFGKNIVFNAESAKMWSLKSMRADELLQ